MLHCLLIHVASFCLVWHNHTFNLEVFNLFSDWLCIEGQVFNSWLGWGYLFLLQQSDHIGGPSGLHSDGIWGCYSECKEADGWSRYLLTTLIMHGSVAALARTYPWHGAQLSTMTNLPLPLCIGNFGWNSLLHSQNLTLELNYFTFFFFFFVYWLWLVGVSFCRNLNAN